MGQLFEQPRYVAWRFGFPAGDPSDLFVFVGKQGQHKYHFRERVCIVETVRCILIIKMVATPRLVTTKALIQSAYGQS